MTVSEEKREHPRVDFATQINIILDIEGEQFCLEGDSTDLSLKGMFVKTDRHFAVGTHFDITVNLTGSIEKLELQMKGTVVRKTENGMGLAFDAMDVDTYSHLKNIVMYNRADDSA